MFLYCFRHLSKDFCHRLYLASASCHGNNEIVDQTTKIMNFRKRDNVQICLMHQNEICLKNSIRHYPFSCASLFDWFAFWLPFFSKVYSLLTLGTGFVHKKFPSSHFLGNPKEEKNAVDLFFIVTNAQTLFFFKCPA